MYYTAQGMTLVALNMVHTSDEGLIKEGMGSMLADCSKKRKAGLGVVSPSSGVASDRHRSS